MRPHLTSLRARPQSWGLSLQDCRLDPPAQQENQNLTVFGVTLTHIRPGTFSRLWLGRRTVEWEGSIVPRTSLHAAGSQHLSSKGCPNCQAVPCSCPPLPTASAQFPNTEETTEWVSSRQHLCEQLQSPETQPGWSLREAGGPTLLTTHSGRVCPFIQTSVLSGYFVASCLGAV